MRRNSLTTSEVTELRQELEQRAAEVGSLREEKARWIGALAHDLRHPVSALITYSELLLEERENLRADDLALVSAIRSCAESMSRLIDDAFDLAMLDTIPISEQPIDVEALLHDGIDAIRPVAHRKKMRITFHASRGCPPVLGDFKRLLQVFTNILDNAAKYCPPESAVEISVSARNSEIEFAVKDNGPGIPADEIGKIFQPFQKTRIRAATAEPGTGLGLAICKRIIERHGGRIWVQSATGAGAAFFIALPAAKVAASA